MKIIFLDIDGVLNYTSWYYSDRNPGNLYGQEGDIDPMCVDRILRIVNETDAKIVISSDWRIAWEGCLMRLEKMGLTRDIVIDKTPEFIWRGYYNTDFPMRGSEIEEWLKSHPDCTNYVIIDDRTDFTEEQEPHFVHINSMYGITDEDADIAIMTLNHH